jgi:hypothetical protein
MAEQVKSGIASLADRARDMFRRVVEYPDPSVVMADQVDPNITPQTYSDLFKGSVAGTVSIPGEIGAALKPAIPVLPKTGSLAPVRLASEVLQPFPTTEPITQFAVDKGLITRETAESPAYFGGQFLSPVPAGAVAGVSRAAAKLMRNPQAKFLDSLKEQGVLKDQIPTKKQRDVLREEWPYDDLYDEFDFELSPEKLESSKQSLSFTTSPYAIDEKKIFDQIERWTRDFTTPEDYYAVRMNLSDRFSVQLSSYQEQLRDALVQAYPNGKIPVKRRVPFEVNNRDYVAENGKIVKEPAKFKTFLTDVDDVVFASFFREPELVVRNKNGDLISTTPLSQEDLKKVKKGGLEYDPNYELDFAKSFYYPTPDNLTEQLDVLDEYITETYYALGQNRPNADVYDILEELAAPIERFKYLIQLTKDPRYSDNKFLQDLIKSKYSVTGYSDNPSRVIHELGVPLESPSTMAPVAFAEGGFVEKLKKLGSDIINYPDPNIVMADQAAPIPEVLKDPRTYIEAEKGAVAGTLGLPGDIGSMSEGVADYIQYMPTFLRAPVQTLMQLPTTEDVKEFGIEKGLLTREETEGVPFQVGEFFSPVSGAAAVKGAKVLSKFGPQAGKYISQEGLLAAERLMDKAPEVFQPRLNIVPEGPTTSSLVRPITRHMGVTSYARKLAEGVKRKKGTTAEFVNELKARAKKDQKEVNFNSEIKAMGLDLTDTTPISREQFQKRLSDNELSIDLTVLGEVPAKRAVFGEAMEIEPSSEDLVQFNQIFKDIHFGNLSPSTYKNAREYTLKNYPPEIIPIETPEGDYALVRSMIDGKYELQKGLGDYQEASFGTGQKKIILPDSNKGAVTADNAREAMVEATDYFDLVKITEPSKKDTKYVHDLALEGDTPVIQTKRREFLISSPQIKGNFEEHFGPAQTATQDNVLAHMLITDWEGPVKLEDGTVLNPDLLKDVGKTGQATSKIFYVDEVQDDLTKARQRRNTFDSRMDTHKASYAAKQKEVTKMIEDLAPDNRTAEELSEYVTTRLMRKLTTYSANPKMNRDIEQLFSLLETRSLFHDAAPIGRDPTYKPVKDFLIDLERNKESLNLIKPIENRPMTYIENPWAKVSHETALKQALRIAVNEDYDYLMVPNEKMPEIKYKKGKADSLKNLYQEKVPKILKKIAKTYNTEVINAFLNDVVINDKSRLYRKNVDLGAYVIKLTPELKKAVSREGVGDTFAQGGVVRKQGIGTLNEIARTMFQRPRGVSGLSSVARNMFQ